MPALRIHTAYSVAYINLAIPTSQLLNERICLPHLHVQQTPVYRGAIHNGLVLMDWREAEGNLRYVTLWKCVMQNAQCRILRSQEIKGVTDVQPLSFRDRSVTQFTPRLNEPDVSPTCLIRHQRRSVPLQILLNSQYTVVHSASEDASRRSR